MTGTEPSFEPIDSDFRPHLDREELIEQAYLYRTLCERIDQHMPVQELLPTVREEVLATTQLPLAIDFLQTELVHSGLMGKAMLQLSHYFTPFQTYVIQEAESETGRFDMRLGFEILQLEAEYLASEQLSPQGLFMYHFETLCRNRLRYDPGLEAVANDPVYDRRWRDWILTVRRQIGLIDLADLVYVRSSLYRERLWRARESKADSAEQTDEAEVPILFGSRDGKIAFANRQKDPLYLFSAMQRQLGYPAVPRRKTTEDSVDLVDQLMRRVERLESQVKLMEEDQTGGIDLSQFYQRPDSAG